MPPYVKFISHPIAKRYPSYRGVSERIIRRHLERQGWQVWRGGFLHAFWNEELFPSVRRKYSLLQALMTPEQFGDLQLLSSFHYGMPDFLCYRREFLFIECKLGHEPLSDRQKKCISMLLELGWKVEIHALVHGCTSARRGYFDLSTGKKNIQEKQLKLKLKW